MCFRDGAVTQQRMDKEASNRDMAVKEALQVCEAWAGIAYSMSSILARHRHKPLSRKKRTRRHLLRRRDLDMSMSDWITTPKRAR